MRKNKTKLIIVLLVFGALVIGLFYFNSTTFKIKQYEKVWDIDLPEATKLDFSIAKTHIDGSVKYFVFKSQYEPDESLFLNMENIKKEDFES